MESFPDIDLFPRLTRAAQFLGRLLPMHLLSEQSDHKFEHPLDESLTPITDLPDVELGYN